MSKTIKSVVSPKETFDLLDIRVGRVIRVEFEKSADKKSYRIDIDFGKYGIKTSIGRFTQHSIEDLMGKQVLGVLNFGVKDIGNAKSEVLVLGVQYPKAESGEATFVTPVCEAKLGSKLF